MKKIKTFQQACKALGIEPETPFTGNLERKDQLAIIAFYKLTIIARALNEGWKPNWSDWDEDKYFPVFRCKEGSKKNAGFGFSYSDFGWSSTCTNVGSRLCFKTQELAEYAGKTFEKLYKQFLMLP